MLIEQFKSLGNQIETTKKKVTTSFFTHFYNLSYYLSQLFRIIWIYALLKLLIVFFSYDTI